MAQSSPRNKIWHLLDSSAIGGIETHVLALARSQRAQDLDVEVLFLKDHGPHPLRARLEKFGVPWRCLDGSARGLMRLISRDGPTLIHSHGYKANILGRIAGRLTGVPVVTTFHNGDNGTGKLRLYTSLDRITAPLGRSIAVNETIARKITGHATVIPNGVFIPDAQTEQRGKEIAFVGRLSHEKGPDLFCELAGQCPDLDFAVYGDGPMMGELGRSHGNSVTFHGSVDDLDDRWASIGLLVMSSRAEGLPMAALEAMANGVPVAAFDVGALASVTADGRGWCVPEGETKALANAVREWSALTTAQSRSLSERCRQYVSDAGSASQMAARVSDVYAQALA